MGKALLTAALAACVLSLSSGGGRVRAEPAAEPPAPGAPQPKPAVLDPAGPIQALALELAAARAALSKVPALAQLAPAFTLFSDSDADAALRRGGRSRDGVTLWTFLPAAFSWTPRAGRQFWVLTGRSGTRALVAVLEHRDGRLTHAASTMIDEPEATIALGYSAQYPLQLVWTTCYGCAGEGGTIVLREDGRVAFSYR